MSDNFNVNEFIAEVESRGGLLKPSRFRARFPLPLGMIGSLDARETTRSMEYWCDSAAIPSVIHAVHSVMRYGYGQQENKPFLTQIQNINFTFLADADGDNWRFFYEWMNLILNTRFSRGIVGADQLGSMPYEISYKPNYVSDIQVTLFNEELQPTFSAILEEAYPIFLGDLNLNWNEQNQIVRFPVTFTFASWAFE